MQAGYYFAVRFESCSLGLDENYVKRYFALQYGYIFTRIPYSLTVSVLKVLFDIINNYTASYGNWLVMMCSIALAQRFRQIGQRLQAVVNGSTVRCEATWAQVRTDFVHVCDLLEAVDVALAPLILLSCVNNLYFICAQLLAIFECVLS